MRKDATLITCDRFLFLASFQRQVSNRGVEVKSSLTPMACSGMVNYALCIP